MSKYLGCIICGLRYVAADDDCSSGCENCGSSIAVIIKELSPEAEKALRENAQRSGTPDPPKRELNFWEE